LRIPTTVGDHMYTRVRKFYFCARVSATASSAGITYQYREAWCISGTGSSSTTSQQCGLCERQVGSTGPDAFTFTALCSHAARPEQVRCAVPLNTDIDGGIIQQSGVAAWERTATSGCPWPAVMLSGLGGSQRLDLDVQIQRPTWHRLIRVKRQNAKRFTINAKTLFRVFVRRFRQFSALHQVLLTS